MKFLKTSLQENIKSKSMPTAEMYEAKTLTKINRAGQFLSVLSVIMGLWVIASVIFPAVTPLTPADFGKQGDEWEQDMRRRIAEVVIRKIALGAASILILFVAVTILDTQGQVIYKVIGNAATPSD